MKVTNVDHPAFKKVLEGLPQDDAWDEEDQFEAAYKKSNMVRYVFEKKDTVANMENKETKSEAFTSQIDSSSSQAMLTAGSSGDKAAHVTIKIEDPEYVQLKTNALALKSGEQAVHNISRQLKHLLPSLESKKSLACPFGNFQFHFVSLCCLL